MFGTLALTFLVVSVVEAVILVKVGGAIGVLNTLAVLLLVSVAGAWLVKREGIGVWRRLTSALREGRTPAREVADAALIVVGGTLLVTPGFLTDLVGLLLLLPPARAVVRTSLLAWLAKRARTPVVTWR